MLKWDGENANIGSISGVSNDIAVPKGSKVITRGGGVFSLEVFMLEPSKKQKLLKERPHGILTLHFHKNMQL